MGLFLVTKLLPQGTADVLRAVIASVGFKFLNRLVLPLQRRLQVGVTLSTISGLFSHLLWSPDGLTSS